MKRCIGDFLHGVGQGVGFGFIAWLAWQVVRGLA